MKTSDYKKEEIFNFSYLDELADGDVEFKLKIFRYFIKNVPGLIKKIKSSYIKKDWEVLRENSHKLKSAMSFLGIKPIEKDVEVLEVLAVNKTDVKEISQYIEKIEKLCFAAVDILKQEITMIK